MKKLNIIGCLGVLLVGLLFSQASYANNVTLNKFDNERFMQERSEAIAGFIEETYSMNGVIGDATDFFIEHPEYVIDESLSSNTVNKIDTIAINSNLENKVMNKNGKSKLVEVDFYDNGSFIISELEKIPLVDNNQLLLKGDASAAATHSVLGQNTHHIYNTAGQYVGRSYVEARFNYNGTKVTYGSRRANVRSLMNNYRVEKVGDTPVMSYPSEYHGNICRAQYISFWHKRYGTGETMALMDTNRVSCNQKGKIYRTSPDTCI